MNWRRTSVDSRRPTSGRAGSGIKWRTEPRWKRRPSTDARSITLAQGGLGVHCHELLDEEWVAFGRIDDAPAVVSRDVAQLGHERLDIAFGQRFESQQRCVWTLSRPAGPRLEELWAGRAQHEELRVAAEIGQVVEQVEQRLLRPVDVVDEDDQRRVPGERLE
jgi:hypothetical protein